MKYFPYQYKYHTIQSDHNRLDVANGDQPQEKWTEPHGTHLCNDEDEWLYILIHNGIPLLPDAVTHAKMKDCFLWFVRASEPNVVPKAGDGA